ncbi:MULTISPECIES: putative quinol monooxygenase [unclassified Streptomyces]|uniref:putative quinol monooxygenase n=1 Tax=unclassified Streptomyces TaxID=2593676 RepID=UPI002DDAD98B|nr:putative quinol monooxygenase [Streptomyces sp. NBC_01445]WSE02436.1 antibiotic biosynthesis monooxygenase [Streptomyces sp. NBC_01445]
MSYVVIATMIAKPGQEELVEKTLRAAAADVHAEPGCARWALHRKTGTTGHFVMVEKWQSKEALHTHGKGAALAGIGRALKDALEGPADVTVFDALLAGDAEKGAL